MPFFRCSKILGEAGKQEILQQIFQKFQISNRLPNRYFPQLTLSFQQLSFKLSSFTNFKALFPVVLTDFPSNQSMLVAEKKPCKDLFINRLINLSYSVLNFTLPANMQLSSAFRIELVIMTNTGESIILTCQPAQQALGSSWRKRVRARARETRVRPTRAPVFSCAHYFQAPATHATHLQTSSAN